MNYRPHFICYPLFLLCTLAFDRIYAQSGETAETTVIEALEEDYTIHHLYKGRAFVPLALKVNGSPNFANMDMVEEGWVVYDGVRYEGVPLMYDLNQDILVSRHPSDLFGFLILEQHLIEAFGFDNLKFVNIPTGHPDLKPGYYQELYNSDGFICYVSRSKVIETHTYGSILERDFLSSANFYVDNLHNDDGFTLINRQRDLLRLVPDQRRGVRNALRAADLRFRTQPDQTIVAVLEYLDLSL